MILFLFEIPMPPSLFDIAVLASVVILYIPATLARHFDLSIVIAQPGLRLFSLFSLVFLPIRLILDSLRSLQGLVLLSILITPGSLEV